MTFEWNSGPYIQYAYVRANKIINDSPAIEQVETLDSKIEIKAKEITRAKIIN